MDLATIRAFFLWCTIINGWLLIFWTIVILAARDLAYRTQRVWFPISRETFNVAMYGFLGLFKMLVIVLNLVPYLALLIVG